MSRAHSRVHYYAFLLRSAVALRTLQAAAAEHYIGGPEEPAMSASSSMSTATANGTQSPPGSAGPVSPGQTADVSGANGGSVQPLASAQVHALIGRRQSKQEKRNKRANGEKYAQ